MRSLFFIAAVIGLSAPAYTTACPNFSGSFSSGKSSTWAEETIYEISQTGCEKIKMIKSVHSVGNVNPPIVSELITDGVRRIEDFPGVYWVNFWENDRLVREPWSAQTDGELVGERNYWFLRRDAQDKVSLTFQYVNDTGNILSEETVQKQ